VPKDKVAKAKTLKTKPPAPAVVTATPTAMTRIDTLAELPVRGRVIHSGYVESITIQPQQQAPSFSVTIVDRPAPPGGRRSAVVHLRLIFVGQRRVPGLVAGSRLSYEGMVAPLDSVPTIFNPRYEILPAYEKH
jgi:hypothetical protein